MKRPLGVVALLYAGGLMLGECIRAPLLLLFVAGFALLLVALLFHRARLLALGPLILLMGWTNLTCRTAVLSPHDLRRLAGDSPEEVVVRGRLIDTPEQRIYARGGVERTRTLAQLAVSEIRRGTNAQPAWGTIVAGTPGALPRTFFANQEVEVAGILAAPGRPLAEGLFDYRAYLRRQGIYFELKPSSPADWRLLSPDRRRPLSDRFLEWAKSTMGRGLPEEDLPLRLLWAMTLGSKDVLTSDAYLPFVESGTMHIFAISGLHIALIAGILVSLLRVLQVSRAWCGLVVIPIIWSYTAATGWQPSAVRSTVMMSVIIAGWSLRRPSDLLNSLAAAALIILIWDPQQMFQASFQLSFFVVLSIALLLPPLQQFRDRLLRTDPLLPADLVPRWKRWLLGPVRFISTCFITSLAAWLGSWPLTACYFHLFSPVTLLANLVIVPLSSLALAANLGSLICGGWFPWATELFNFSAWWWMWLMMELSRLSTLLPGAFLNVPAPAPADFLIYYSALIGVLSGFVFAAKHRVWVAAWLICAVAVYSWRWHEARSTTLLTVLPLEGGSAVVCDAPGRSRDLLIDCGNSNAVEFVTGPFLQGQGVNRVPHLALTHGDLRHVGGTGLLWARMPVDQTVLSTARFRSAAYRNISSGLEATPAVRRTVQPGDTVAGWRVLHPPPGNRVSAADDNALVLFGDVRGTRVLLLSDLARPGQNALLESTLDLRADIVIAGLSDRGEPLCEALLDAVQPKLIVIADSEFPATARASTALRARLEQRTSAVRCTREDRAVTIVLRRNHWIARSLDGVRARSE